MAEEFFPQRPGAETLLSCAALARRGVVTRSVVCDLLLEQARAFGCAAAAFNGIEKLRAGDTVAVVTHVNPGLLGGTLSSWLAMLTAVHLASWLERQGRPAIPVCWIDSPDRSSDLRTGLISRDGPVRVALDLNPAETSIIPDSVQSLLLETAQALEVGLNESDVLRVLASAYAPRTSLTAAYCRAAAKLLAHFGIVLIDPSTPAFEERTRRLLPPIDHAGLADLARAADRRLEAGGYNSLRSDEAPESARFKTTVISDIIRNLLLPAAVNVVSEDQIYDAARAQSVMAAQRITPPLFWPRISATGLDARCRKTLRRYGLSPEEAYRGPAALSELLTQRIGIQETSERVADLEKNMRQQLAEIRKLVPGEGKVARRVQDSCARMLYQAEKLRSRTSDAGVRRREAISRQIARLCSIAAPWERRQETELAGFQFLLRYSDTFPGILYDQVDPFKFEHQIISVE